MPNPAEEITNEHIEQAKNDATRSNEYILNASRFINSKFSNPKQSTQPQKDRPIVHDGSPEGEELYTAPSIRVKPDLRQKVMEAAEESNKSKNSFLQELFSFAVEHMPSKDRKTKDLKPTITEACLQDIKRRAAEDNTTLNSWANDALEYALEHMPQ